jgi:hypothetical protein
MAEPLRLLSLGLSPEAVVRDSHMLILARWRRGAGTFDGQNPQAHDDDDKQRTRPTG